MTTDNFERDFQEFNKNLKFPGRFDPRLLQNVDDVGDGFPGLQKMVRNWVKYYLSEGIIEQAIHMNSKKITNLADPVDDQDGATKKSVDDVFVPHIADTNAHIDNLTDITTRNHNDLQTIGANDHIDNLTDIPTRNHSSLQTIGANDHINNLNQITTRNHSDLEGVTANQHISNLNQITTRNHSDLQGVTANQHIDNLTDIPTRNHADLQGVTAHQPVDNLTDIPPRNHSDLQGVTTSQHHVKYSDVDARGAINDVIGSDGKADATLDLDANYLDNVNKAVLDHISVPDTVSSHGIIYVDTSDTKLYFKDSAGGIVPLS